MAIKFLPANEWNLDETQVDKVKLETALQPVRSAPPASAVPWVPILLLAGILAVGSASRGSS